MANRTIKPSTITRVGYEYQDLVGIEALIRYYRDPDTYSWVQLEAVDDGTALDDVVVSRRDGAFEYLQVKFTVDKTDYPLNWAWLTDRKPNGTSLLTKWATSLRKLAATGLVHSATLRTNRVPSTEVASCLSGKRLDLSKASPEVRATLENHCGGKAEAIAFFNCFEFDHSERDLDDYEAFLRDQLVPSDLDPNGWFAFREQVRTWTTRRNQPPPDGRVLFAHLSQTITRQRPQPIRQDFRVPPDYIVPSQAFDAEVTSRLTKGAPLTIVWGTPGKGKSTYLSLLAERLRKAGDGAVVIRHHYFLAMDDTTPDRMSFATIAASLVNQLTASYPESVPGGSDDPTRLRSVIKSAAEYLAAKHQRLYILIDGLDHVWRDTARVDQLNQLFVHLLPSLDNVSLVVGTQKVLEDQLPKRLVQSAKKVDWLEIPAMDEISVSAWVKAQYKAKRLLLRLRRSETRRELVDSIAKAFFTVSQGHPLHLIYAFESLALSNKRVRAEDVLALPPCPDGDIRVYYAALWGGLSTAARNTLHALAGTTFYWPGDGIRKCFGDYSEIAFLLDVRQSGLVPFHGSIFAYVRERPDHVMAYQALLPVIVKWLEVEAPDYWRWGWLWITKAQMGDPVDLLAGTTRKWIVDSLANGWNERQTHEILRAAEWAAFKAADLPRTTTLRWLRIRLLNSPEQQSQDFAAFKTSALAAAKNWQQVRIYSDEVESVSDSQLATLAGTAPAGFEDELRDICVGELTRRINVWIELRHRPENEFMQLTHHLLHAAGGSGIETAGRVLSFLEGFKDFSSLLIEYTRAVGKAANLDVLIWLLAKLTSAWSPVSKIVQDELVRTLGYLDVEMSSRVPRPPSSVSPLLACYFGTRDQPVGSMALPVAPARLGDEEMRAGMGSGADRFLHTVFFSALATAFRAEGNFSWVYPGLDLDQVGWLSEAIHCLERTASYIAAGKLELSFSAPYLGAADLAEVRFRGNSNEADYRRYIEFRGALRQIACDLHLISLRNEASSQVALSELEVARSSIHWVDSLWIEDDTSDERRILDQTGAEVLLRDSVEALASTVTEFMERTDTWVKLAKFSAAYGLGREPELIRRAADCLMGYGNRKDMSGIEALDAVEQVHLAGGADALPAILKLTPIVEQITKFTDGDETDHVRSKLIEVVAKTRPEKLPMFYAHHVECEEWRYADECIKEFFTVGDFGSEAVAALAATLMDHGTLGALGAAGAHDAAAEKLHADQVAFLGGEPKDRHDRSSRSNGLGAGKPWRTKPAKFKADQFGKVASEVGKAAFDFRNRRAFVSGWLSHWTSEGEGKVAIDSIDQFFTSGKSTYHIEDSLDDIFEVSRKLEGKKAAYKWLVRAHSMRNGWASYWAPEDEVMRRLSTAARLYGSEWWKFIVDTAVADRYGRSAGGSFVIGQRYLVGFLILVGQIDIAATVAHALVHCLTEEVKDQPIPEAPWLT
ncbi:NACHT domain-containing protein [Mesorhizobium sp. ESP7-2]|uniref:dsDNA nuclease domain-containing protein n=1 Tax=Mesorhizobium sp. ESP7-2 TaxID=2876622 RepID=UPI001CCF4D3B|nr:dsDNA nuclease domain-containing protein [Mesorhizobium sp. ESP7-2]MBZ9709304.1 NACHT domain-containing protein [Mesorhizobium sp. ESP7-2]